MFYPPFLTGGGVTGAKSSHCGRRPGYTLNESPALRRTLTDAVFALGFFSAVGQALREAVAA